MDLLLLPQFVALFFFSYRPSLVRCRVYVANAIVGIPYNLYLDKIGRDHGWNELAAELSTHGRNFYIMQVDVVKQGRLRVPGRPRALTAKEFVWSLHTTEYFNEQHGLNDKTPTILRAAWEKMHMIASAQDTNRPPNIHYYFAFMTPTPSDHSELHTLIQKQCKFLTSHYLFPTWFSLTQARGDTSKKIHRTDGTGPD